MKRRVVVALCVAVGSLVPGTVSRAEDETVEVDVSSQLQDKRGQGTSGLALDFSNDTIPVVASYIQGIGASARDQVLCDSLPDSRCSPETLQTLIVRSVLGVCQSDLEAGCVETLSVRSATGALVPLKAVGADETVFAEVPEMAVPRGATASTWEDQTGARYVVRAVVRTQFRSKSSSWEPMTPSLQIDIRRIPRGQTAGVYKPRWEVDPATGMPIFPHYLVSGSGLYVPLTSGVRFNLRIRVPSSVSGWFQGRVGNAVIGSRQLSNNRIVYEIEGDVMSVYAAAVIVPETDPDFGSLPANYRENYAGRVYTRGPELSNYTEFGKYIRDDRAFAVTNKWSVSSVGLGTGKCFEGTTGLTGVAYTNAAFYQTSVPTFDTKTGSFDYKVASLHYDQNGALARGSYSLSIPLAALRCLYGVTVNPSAARISVEYTDGEEPSVAVKSVIVKDGWVNVSHTGFTYSAPTIRTTFGVVASDTGSTNQGNFASLLAKQKASSSARNHLRTTIRGSRATLTINLTKTQTVEVFRKVGKKLTLLKRFPGRKGANTFRTTYRKNYTFLVFGAGGRQIEPLVGSSGAFRAGLGRLS